MVALMWSITRLPNGMQAEVTSISQGKVRYVKRWTNPMAIYGKKTSPNAAYFHLIKVPRCFIKWK